jgi:serine/threonine protein kinase
MIDKSRLGPFVLEQRLGRQKSGSVYHAVHLQRRRAMAVRIMSQHLGHSAVGVQEFAREVEFLKSLEHPNVVRVYGGGVFDDEAYIAMELVQGESLDEVLAASGRLPWETVVDYATQACQGLEYAHQRGTIHQNLSTAKLLRTPDGHIKITDFRGNRLNQYDRWEAQPHPTAVAYLAPEQLRGDRNVSPKADLYSLGCIVFELLTGRLPFEGRTAIEIREKHLQEPPPRVSALAFDCPIWLDSLVAQMLAKDPNKRPIMPRPWRWRCRKCGRT